MSQKYDVNINTPFFSAPHVTVEKYYIYTIKGQDLWQHKNVQDENIDLNSKAWKSITVVMAGS